MILKELCNKASDIRSAQETIKKAEQEQKKIETKKQTGFLSAEDQQKSEQKFEEFKQKREKAQQKLIKLQNEDKQKGAPLSFMFNNDLLASQNSSSQPFVSKTEQPTQIIAAPSVEYNVNSTAKLRTDNDIYKKFTNKEKLLINTIYNTIYNAFPDEGMRESLIKKIERELTK